MHDAGIIDNVQVRAVIAPLARPVRTAVGTVPSAPLVLIDIRTSLGVVGTAYIFAYTAVALGGLARLAQDIGAELVGTPAAPLACFAKLDRRFRLLGKQGLVGMVVSGIDMALWDAHAKRLGLGVSEVLGAKPAPLRAYDSYGVVDPRADARALQASVDAGFTAIKIKLGDGDLAADVATTAAVRDLIGPDVDLMVDYNQSLNVAEALRRIDRLTRFNLLWVEEPVHAEDHAAHARVRTASPVSIQAGENWWFPAEFAAAITSRASDYLMPDLMKCGGVTGWLAIAGMAAGAALPVSSHLFVEASAHVLAATPTRHFIEVLDIAGAVLANPVTVEHGQVTARGPGLGIAWDEAAVRRHAA